MKRIIYILLISCCVFSCGEQDVAKYDVFSGQTLVAFESSDSNIDVLIGNEGSVEIPIVVSTFSDVDRTLTIAVLPFPEGTDDAASPNQYSFDETVVVPANSLQGILKVKGLDVDLEAGKKIKVQFQVNEVNFGNVTIADRIHTVSLALVCPVPEDYMVGKYILTSPLANIWCSNPQPSFIGNDVEVELVVGSTPAIRVFKARYTPGSCDAFSKIVDFDISLICDVASLRSRVETGVFCGGASIFIANDASRPTTYITSDDSSITINVIEHPDAGTCTGAPHSQSFTLTKV